MHKHVFREHTEERKWVSNLLFMELIYGLYQDFNSEHWEPDKSFRGSRQGHLETRKESACQESSPNINKARDHTISQQCQSPLSTKKSKTHHLLTNLDPSTCQHLREQTSRASSEESETETSLDSSEHNVMKNHEGSKCVVCEKEFHTRLNEDISKAIEEDPVLCESCSSAERHALLAWCFFDEFLVQE